MSGRNSAQRKAAQSVAAICGAAGVAVIGYVLTADPMHPAFAATLLAIGLGLFWIALRLAADRHFKLERLGMMTLLCVGAIVLLLQRGARADVAVLGAVGVSTKADGDGLAARFTVFLDIINRGDADADVDIKSTIATFVLEDESSLRTAREVALYQLGTAPFRKAAVGIVPAGQTRQYSITHTILSVSAPGTPAYLLTGTLYYPSWPVVAERAFCVVLRGDGTNATPIDCDSLSP